MKYLSEEPTMLLPHSLKDMESKRHLRIPVGPLLAMGLFQVPIGMAYNLVMALVTDFEATTYTTCHAFNLIPSSSAAAKSQHLVWTIACWSELPFLLATAWLQFRFYRRTLPRPVRFFGYLITCSMCLVGCGMVLWATFADADGDSVLHVATALFCFVSCAVNIAGSFMCTEYYAKDGGRQQRGEFSHRIKSCLVFTYFVTVPIMWVWYFLHHKFCLPMAYSLFALGEFISSECYGLYLCTVFWDFYHVVICHDQRLGFFLSEI
ncbi:hypothetical protein KR009_006532 [Drosophila setifemur]|nr:hypothetical protein KR009_006532 [Drosophila setifemur]